MTKLTALTQKWINDLRRSNLPLFLGTVITLMVMAIALWGYRLAPQDPMKEHYALDFGQGIRTPPYPPFKLAEYPLGTDRFGRDLLSRILWGVRPTMILVVSVATVRLVFALLIGLLAGWSTGPRRRLMDNLISAALSVPVLFVALAGITLVGIDRGLIAFIIGLALTGWADTARLVAEQTRAIKQQTYVEMAHALGASTSRTLLFHILPQIMPLVWMLLAFELGSTLLVVAELGFLEYYIGGGVWIEISDFVTVNTAGLPELGQMLSQALVKLTDPSAMIVVGSVLFIMILGFNLLGEGLRLELMPERMRHHSVMPIVARFSEWWRFQAFPALEDWFIKYKRALGTAAAVLFIASAALFWWNTRPAAPQQAAAGMEVPGGNLWASERYDAQGTRFTAVNGPQHPKLLWNYQYANVIVGGPVVRKDGTIIFAGQDNALVALDPQGQLLWQAALSEEPIGTPALDAEGGVYVTDKKGGLTHFPFNAIQPDWRYQPESEREATSGPIVAHDGTIFYTVIDSVQAVSPRGEALWRVNMTDDYLYAVPRLSPQESFVFLQNDVVTSSNGAEQDTSGLFRIADPNLLFSPPEIFVGPDKRLYLRVGHGAYAWHTSAEGMIIDQIAAKRDVQASTFFPFDAGAISGQRIWLLYTSDYTDTEIAWLDMPSNTLISDYTLRATSGRMISVDENGTTYICGTQITNIQCVAVSISGAEKWTATIMDGFQVAGGALIEGRLYITAVAGLVAALGDAP